MIDVIVLCFFFFFKQKTAYEMRISDWSSDVCSSDLSAGLLNAEITPDGAAEVARRSRGTPRIANRLLRRVRDYAQVKSHGVIDTESAGRAQIGRASCRERVCQDV